MRDSIFHLPLAASNPSLLLRIQCWGASQSWILCCPRRKFSEMSFPVAARRSAVANPHSGGPKELLRYLARYAHRAANSPPMTLGSIRRFLMQVLAPTACWQAQHAPTTLRVSVSCSQFHSSHRRHQDGYHEARSAECASSVPAIN